MDKRLNILGFTNYTGSAQWRMQGPANYINARTEHEYYVTSSKNWNEDTLGADVVVAQMWRNPKGIDICHEQGAKVVYEADDIVLGVGGKDRKTLMDMTPEMEEMTKETIAKSDVVTVTTEVLKDHYKQWNDNVVVVPNYMDYMWWGQAWKAKPYNQIRIGWMGSTSHREDLIMIEPVIKQILDEFSFVKFVYCGTGGVRMLQGEELFTSLDPSRKEFYIGVPLEYWPQKSKSLGIDIGIAPLVDDEFNAGKSAIKYYEYSANGVPAVYSDTVVYNKTVRHGETGFLAKTEDEWVKHLSRLILNHETTVSTAKNAFEDVLHNYSLDDHYQEWLEVFK